jgi:hypothetical protein
LPATVRPSSPAPCCASSTTQRPRLFQAVQRYTDGLHVAAEQLVGPQSVAELDQADHYIPGLTTEPGWPTLRAHLLNLAAETGKHPLRHMLTCGIRRLNRTLHDILLTRWRTCQRTQAYIARRRAEGKTDPEIRRCLKRYIARELYPSLNTAMAA